MALSEVKALTFDVFGTVVDYRSTIIHEGALLNQAKGLQVDWAHFADAWRGQYRPAMDRVGRGDLPWMNLDALHWLTLEEVLKEFKITDLTKQEEANLHHVWHRLEPWPDSVEGLNQLRQKRIIATLSNANVALLTNMARYSNLPWDCILSAELAKAYKPDPKVYHLASELLGLAPEQIMMVAAHQYDLRATQSQGFKTAFVPRPHEYGPEHIPDRTPDSTFDVVASDLIDLARQLEG
jgi:2-haloacid dehalogenase